jgi:hypothetical protein
MILDLNWWESVMEVARFGLHCLEVGFASLDDWLAEPGGAGYSTTGWAWFGLACLVLGRLLSLEFGALVSASSLPSGSLTGLSPASSSYMDGLSGWRRLDEAAKALSKTVEDPRLFGAVAVQPTAVDVLPPGASRAGLRYYAVLATKAHREGVCVCAGWSAFLRGKIDAHATAGTYRGFATGEEAANAALRSPQLTGTRDRVVTIV